MIQPKRPLGRAPFPQMCAAQFFVFPGKLHALYLDARELILCMCMEPRGQRKQEERIITGDVEAEGTVLGRRRTVGEGSLDERAIAATIPLYANQKYANKG